jgi:glycogen(starch) synthase
MKVVIATHGFLPSIGGVSTTESILARAFVDAGHNVSVVALNPGPTDGYVHRVYRAPGPLTLFRLYSGADVLILSNLSIRLIYPLLLIRRPFALRHHSESAFRLSGAPLSLDRLRRAVLPRARHFMTSAYVGARSGFDRYVVTHPFSNPHHITPDVIQPPHERRGALFVGRLEPEKGVRWMLERWPKIGPALGVETLRLVGGGSLEDEVQSSIASGALPGVTCVGPLQRAETAREMGRAAYLLVPSLWEEPFGAVALEGIAAGAITVLSRRGGLPEAAGDLGIYFDPDNEVSFEQALDRARSQFEEHVTSPSARRSYKLRTAKHLAKFQPNVVVDKILREMSA